MHIKCGYNKQEQYLILLKVSGFAELKRIGSPIEFDPTTGVTKIGNTEITQQLLKSLGIKVPKTTEDGRLILPTSDFLGKFFTTQGDQQYWKILVATGNPNIKNAGDAMLTPTGKWIKNTKTWLMKEWKKFLQET